jgi:hypothetical protein
MKLAQDHNQRQALGSALQNLQRWYVCHTASGLARELYLYLHVLKMRLTHGHFCVNAIIGRGETLHTIAVYVRVNSY